MSEAALHSNPTDTEIGAASVIQPHINRLQGLVLGLLDQQDDLTPEEMCERLGLPPYKRTSIGPRCTELRDLGLIEDSGNRRKGPHQGSPSIAWRRVR